MRSTVRIGYLALALLLVAPVAAQAQSGKLPALLDRELFFGNPEISGAQISPDGRFVSFLKPYKDTVEVHEKNVEALKRELVNLSR